MVKNILLCLFGGFACIYSMQPYRAGHEIERVKKWHNVCNKTGQFLIGCSVWSTVMYARSGDLSMYAAAWGTGILAMSAICGRDILEHQIKEHEKEMKNQRRIARRHYHALRPQRPIHPHD